MYLQAHEFTTELQLALVGAIRQTIITYLVPNSDTPGGVPVKPVSG